RDIEQTRTWVAELRISTEAAASYFSQTAGYLRRNPIAVEINRARTAVIAQLRLLDRSLSDVNADVSARRDILLELAKLYPQLGKQATAERIFDLLRSPKAIESGILRPSTLTQHLQFFLAAGESPALSYATSYHFSNEGIQLVDSEIESLRST